MVPLNLLPPAGSADYVLTGVWSRKAYEEAGQFGTVRVAGSTEGEGFSRIPAAGELDLADSAAYLHLASNNTICGTQWRALPDSGAAPLVVDASSDIFSRPIELERVGLLYAGAQKNLGPAGVTLVIVRDDLVRRAPARSGVPTMLRYATHVGAGSRHNTPPVFAIYMVGLVVRWLLASGGLAEMARRNEHKARKLYAAIDRTPFYRGTAAPDSRSQMNVTFRLPDAGAGDALRRRSAAGRAGRAPGTPLGRRRPGVDLQRLSRSGRRRPRRVHGRVRAHARLTAGWKPGGRRRAHPCRSRRARRALGLARIDNVRLPARNRFNVVT